MHLKSLKKSLKERPYDWEFNPPLTEDGRAYHGNLYLEHKHTKIRLYIGYDGLPKYDVTLRLEPEKHTDIKLSYFTRRKLTKLIKAKIDDDVTNAFFAKAPGC